MKVFEINEYTIRIEDTTVSVYNAFDEKRTTKSYDTADEAEKAYQAKIDEKKNEAYLRAQQSKEINRRKNATFTTYENAKRVIVDEWGEPETMIAKYRCNECGRVFWAMWRSKHSRMPACECSDDELFVEQVFDI